MTTVRISFLTLLDNVYLDIMSESVQYTAYEHPFPDSIPSDTLYEQSAEIDLSYGRQEVRRWFFDGILIHHTKTQFLDNFCFEKQNPDKMVSLSFNLEGNYEIYQQGKSYHVQKGQHNIIHTRGYGNTFKNKDLVGETFNIEISPEALYRIAKDGNAVLRQFLERMLKDEPVVLSPVSLTIHPDLMSSIRSILHCPYTGSMKKLFLLSKSIEILVLQAEAYDRYLIQNGENKKQKEMDQLVYAREFMEQHMANPPSLSELSREIGLNEYKLKRGFKELYGSTVFGYLSDFRLERACWELQNSSKPIGEIAMDLGYSSSQHFSNAFKKKFGMSPSEARIVVSC